MFAKPPLFSSLFSLSFFLPLLSLSFFLSLLPLLSHSHHSSKEPKYHVTGILIMKTPRHVTYLAKFNSETIKLCNVTMLSGMVVLFHHHLIHHCLWKHSCLSCWCGLYVGLRISECNPWPHARRPNIHALRQCAHRQPWSFA